MWEEARQLGFLEPSRMVMDGVGGAVGGAVAYGSAVALTNVARQLGVLPWNSGPDPVITLRYMPSGPGKGYELIGISRSADTLVPDPAAPQAFNRYAYVLGNP
jgi:hypothetical protein